MFWGKIYPAVLKSVIHIRAVLDLCFRALSRAYGVACTFSTRVSRATRVRARGRDNVRRSVSGENHGDFGECRRGAASSTPMAVTRAWMVQMIALGRSRAVSTRERSRCRRRSRVHEAS